VLDAGSPASRDAVGEEQPDVEPAAAVSAGAGLRDAGIGALASATVDC